MADLIWTLRIREDLSAFATYIATDSPAYAFAFLRRVIEAAENLRTFPMMGRAVPEFDDENIRELILQNYRLIYVIRGDRIFMAAAAHGAMDLRRSLEDRTLGTDVTHADTDDTDPAGGVVLDRIVAWARDNALVRAVLLEGSRGNPSAVIDEFSDYDIAIVVTDRAPFVESVDWAVWLGPILVHWGDQHVSDGIRNNMWLVMYESGTRIDYCVWTQDDLRIMAARGRVPPILDTGYRILLDKDGIAKVLPAATHTAHIPSPPTDAEYLTLVNDFWWETLYVAKNLRRDELFPARWSFDRELKFDMLRRMLEWRIAIDQGWSMRPGNLGRGLKSRLPAERWREIEATFADASPRANWRALWAMLAVFRKTASEVGDALGYRYPLALDERVTAYLRGLCPPEFRESE